MADFQVNTIYFLVSDKDDNSTRELFTTVSHICNRDKLICEYIDINSQNEFKNALNKIEEDCTKKQIKPYIHLACHGSNQGIHLKSSGKIHWDVFANLLTNINIACKNNLFISLSSCYGGYLTLPLIDKVANGHKSRAPFFGLIGPVDEISYGETEAGFLEYFEVILSSKNIDKGIGYLNKSLDKSHGYMYSSCEKIFKDIVEKYVNIELGKIFESKKTFNNHLLEIIKERFRTTGKRSTTEDIKFLENIFSSEKFYVDHFNNIRDHLFMIDLYPENEIRFEKVGKIENWNNLLNRII